MKRTTRWLRPVIALAATAGALMLLGGAQAQAATIEMVDSGGRLAFDGPKTVKAGKTLKIVNKMNPKKHGPHTLSLVKPSSIPNSKKEFRSCFKTGICLDILMAHEANFRTEVVEKPVVDVGAEGWDTQFSGKRQGDTWFTDKKGATHSRKVSADPGTTLGLFCAIHPDMQGKIKVK